MTEPYDFDLAVRLVTLDLSELLDALDASGAQTRSGTQELLLSQLELLRQVDSDLAKSGENQRLRSMVQAIVGVLPALLNSVDKATTDASLPAVAKCRHSIRALSRHLIG